MRKTLLAAGVALIVALAATTEVQAWGAYHFGYNMVGPGGVYRTGNSGYPFGGVAGTGVFYNAPHQFGGTTPQWGNPAYQFGGAPPQQGVPTYQYGGYPYGAYPFGNYNVNTPGYYRRY